MRKYIIIINLLLISISSFTQNEKGDESLKIEFDNLIKNKNINFEIITNTFNQYNKDYFKINLNFSETQKFITKNGDNKISFEDSIILNKTLNEYRKLGLTSNGRIDMIVILDLLKSVNKPSKTTKLITGAFEQLFVNAQMNFSIGIFSSLFTDGLKPKEIEHNVYKDLYIFIITLYILNDNYYYDIYNK